MDDYLSKPVKKPNLEKMLVKWAIEGKRKRAELAKCPGKPVRPVAERLTSFTSDTTTVQSQQEHLSSELDRLEYSQRAAAERSTETVGDSVIRQQEAEEKAISLRDDALIKSGEHYTTKLGRGASDEALQMRHPSSNALTRENIEMLAAGDRAREQGAVARHEGSSYESTLVVELGDAVGEGAGSRVARKSAPG